MELSDFISSTITQIVDGVVDAQEKTKNTGCMINPDNIKVSDRGVYSHNNGYVGLIDFEVGLTEGDKSEGKAGIGVFLGSIGIGANTKMDTNTVSMTSVRFSIPIVLPKSGSLPVSQGSKIRVPHTHQG